MRLRTAPRGVVGGTLRWVIQNILEPVALFFLEFWKRQFPCGPSPLHVAFSLFASLRIQAGVAREVGCLRGKSEASASLIDDILYPQQKVLLDSEKIIFFPARKVAKNIHVLRLSAEADEADASWCGSDHRVAEQELTQPRKDKAHLLRCCFIAKLQRCPEQTLVALG